MVQSRDRAAGRRWRLLWWRLGAGRASPRDREGQPPSPHTGGKRAFLANGVAESGQLDSGYNNIKQEAQGLKGTAGVNADALIQGLDELGKLGGNPSAVTSKAQELLQLLPAS